MLDTKYLRDNIQDLAQKLNIKGFALDVDKINSLEAKRKVLQQETQDLQAKRNSLSKEIGKLKSKGEDASEVMTRVGQIGEQLKNIEAEFDAVSSELKVLQLQIPNIPDQSVPAGKSEDDNIEIKTWGDKPLMDFTPKDHVDLGAASMDFATAAKISGSRFVVLHDKVALLHRALAQFMLDTHITEHGYQEVYVPYLVNTDSLYGTGQLPKFKEDLFTVEGEQGLSLISTAEISVTNIVRDQIIEDKDMPINYVCHSPCFRSEAGSYGRDTRGMIRQHQFDKVEMVKIVRPDDSDAEHEKLLGHAEAVLQKLGLAYRVVILCGGDLGFSARKTYDIEVWLPSQNTYREISSCSNFGDFQARRMKARWRNPETGKPEYLHTLNGSGLAVGRTLVAVLENYQDAEGNIHIPEILQPYMRGIKTI